MITSKSTPEPTIAGTTSPARTVPSGPGRAGEPGRSSGAAGGTPCAGRAALVLAEFVGGPRNGSVSMVEPVDAIAGDGGSYVRAPGHHAPPVYAWHVPAPPLAEQVRPAAPDDLEHVRPADASEDEIRPARPTPRPRSRRSGR